MAPTTRETLCTNGFIIQRKNGKPSSHSHVITTKKCGPVRTARIRAFWVGPKSLGPVRPGPHSPGRAGPLWVQPLLFAQTVTSFCSRLLALPPHTPMVSMANGENDQPLRLQRACRSMTLRRSIFLAS